MSCPNISSASILLAFLIKQSALDPPSHLPLTRAERDAKQRSGLTVEDFSFMTRYEMPTVMESDDTLSLLFHIAENQLSRSMMHSDDYTRAVVESTSDAFTSAHANAPGILTGLWEGQYMVSL